MESTPKHQVRGRHTPTPKMSTRKKALFTVTKHSKEPMINERDDDDLGPIQPLEFSSSPSRYEDGSGKFGQGKSSDFIGILSDDKSNSTTTDAVESTEIDGDKENREDSVLKTPGELVANVPKCSFRKSLIFDTGLTPEDEKLSPRTKKFLQKRPSNVKARTSLTFTEPFISTKSFYGKPIVDQSPKPKQSFRSYPVSGKRLVGKRPVDRRLKSSINRGVSHKIIKPKTKSTNQSKLDRERWINSVMQMIKTSHLPAFNKFRRQDTEITREQITRMHEVLKQKRDSFEDTDDELLGDTSTEQINESVDNDKCPEDDLGPVSKRKFFKTRTPRNPNKYQMTDQLKATVKRGTGVMLLSPERKKKRVTERDKQYNKLQAEVLDIINMLGDDEPTVQDSDYFKSLLPYRTSDPEVIGRQQTILTMLIDNGICTEENFRIFIAEPEKYESEATKILDQLYCVVPDGNLPTENDPIDAAMEEIHGEIEKPMSPASQISTMTLGLVLGSPDRPIPNPPQYFPLFYKEKVRQTLEQTTNPFEQPKSLLKRKFIPIADNQYQLDAGQKAFGSIHCKVCGMLYTVHVPSEEQLHENYHNSINLLRFKGWTNEMVVQRIADWSPNGRIICVMDTDVKVKKQRVIDILEVVDRELGFANVKNVPNSLTYLAIAKNQIIGLCLVHPLNRAHRYIDENGIDCCSNETYPARCGISRIWVVPPYRRFGVATQLFAAVKSHFIIGDELTSDDIAFSTPTDLGKRLASKLSGRSDFLIYIE